MAAESNKKIKKCFIFVQQDFSRSEEQKTNIRNKLQNILENLKIVIKNMESVEATLTDEQYKEIQQKFNDYMTKIKFENNENIERAFSNQNDAKILNKIKQTTRDIRSQQGVLDDKIEKLKFESIPPSSSSGLLFSTMVSTSVQPNDNTTAEHKDIVKDADFELDKTMVKLEHWIQQLTKELEQFMRLLPPSFRKGAEKDKENTEKLFRDLLKFDDVEPHLDKTKDEFLKIIDDFTQMKTTHEYECLVFILSTHGTEAPVGKRGPEVYLKDDLIPMDDVIAKFRNDKCSFLSGRNKIFFIQACRGEDSDTGTCSVYDANPKNNPNILPIDSINSRPQIPRESDFIIHYSTPPGYLSWRDEEDGSYFIECLCIELRKSHSKKDARGYITRRS